MRLIIAIIVVILLALALMPGCTSDQAEQICPGGKCGVVKLLTLPDGPTVDQRIAEPTIKE